MTNNQIKNIAIIGAGKIGQAIANGMTKSGQYLPSQKDLKLFVITPTG